jgi:hypothetical protein
LGDSAQPSHNKRQSPSNILTIVMPSTTTKLRMHSNLAPSKPSPTEGAVVRFELKEDREGIGQSSARQIERSMIGTPCRIKVHLRFEGFPIWLLSLEPTLLSQVVIKNTVNQEELLQSMQTQGFSMELVLAALRNVGLGRVTYSVKDTLPESSLLLVSGSISFVTNWNKKVPSPMLVLCNEHVHNRRTRYGSTLRWTRLRHDIFGGVTH